MAAAPMKVAHRRMLCRKLVAVIEDLDDASWHPLAEAIETALRSHRTAAAKPAATTWTVEEIAVIESIIEPRPSERRQQETDR